MKKEKVFLSWQDMKALEQVIQENWNGKGYKEGFSDAKIAQIVASRRGRAINSNHVVKMRKAMGLKVATWTKRTKLFGVQQAKEVNELLKVHKMLLITRKDDKVQIGLLGE